MLSITVYASYQFLLITLLKMQYFTTQQYLVIVMEYVAGMPFSTLLSTVGPLNEEEARFAFKQVIDAISYCHQKVQALIEPQSWRS